MRKLKLTNEQIVAMKLALDAVDNGQRANASAPFKFPPKGIYWLGRCMGKVKSAFDDLEATRVKLVEKYLEKQAASGIKNPQQLEGEFLASFSKEWQREVLTIEVELELPVIKLSFLALDKNDHLPPSVIRDLEPVLEDDTDAKDEKKDTK